MTSTRNVIITSVMAGVAALLSLLGLISLNSGLAIGVPPMAVAFTSSYEESAYKLLQRSSEPRILAEAEAKARRAVALSPYANAARLRLVYIATAREGRLTPQAVSDFARSYDLVPVDAEVAAWRVRFGLEHWQALPAGVRQSVYKEAMAFWRLGSHDVDMHAVLKSIHDPNGRLAVALWLREPRPNPG